MKKFFGNILTVIIGNILTLVLIGSLIGVLAFFAIAGSWPQSLGVKDGSILELTFDSSIKESVMDEQLSIISPPSGTTVYYRDIIQSIQSAKEDENIKGISLKVSTFRGGATQLTDIRNALLDFKKSGKFIYAYSHNSNQSAYTLNSVADSLFQNPLGTVIVQGLGTEVMFYKNFGEKYGVDFQVIRHGAYKSAVEPYMREELSSENREQLSVLLGDIWENLSSSISVSRAITKEQLNIAADSLYSFNPDLALQHKLVDKIISEIEYEKILADKLELTQSKDESVHDVLKKYTITLEDYTSMRDIESSRNQIAVLYASGPIMPGDGYSGIQSGVYKKTIRDLKGNDDVKAVVLRINSPGGSADASEEILSELRELHKIKPIIVSFGDVAASGGYYIAMESDSIFASPNTITGSIGVLGMIPNVEKLINNVGITTDYVTTNENSNFLKTPFQPMSSTGVQAMTNMTENVYKIFINHVSNARNLTLEQVDSIGGGRVWSGTKAVEIGLVDRLGTLEDAIQAAVNKAGLDDEYSVMNYPFRKGGIEEYLKEFQGVKTESIIQQELGVEYYQMYQELKSMKEYKGVQLRMPFEIKFK
ncbi:MAG: signal peptide peptidase SppA [Moheibacter sp.]